MSETAGELTFASSIKLLSLLFYPSKYVNGLIDDDKFKAAKFLDWGTARGILVVIAATFFNRESIGFEAVDNRFQAALQYNDELFGSLWEVFINRKQDCTTNTQPEIDVSGTNLAAEEGVEVEDVESKKDIDIPATKEPSSSPVAGIERNSFAQDVDHVELIINRLLDNTSFNQEDVTVSDWHTIQQPILVHCFDQTWVEPVLLELWRKIFLRNKGTRLMCTQSPSVVENLLSKLSFKSEVRLLITKIPAYMTNNRFQFHLYQILPPETPSVFDIRRQWALRYTQSTLEVKPPYMSPSFRLSQSSLSSPIALSNSLPEQLPIPLSISSFSRSPGSVSTSSSSMLSPLSSLSLFELNGNCPAPCMFLISRIQLHGLY